MALEMRGACERCGTSVAHDAEAVICSYECTFCRACGEVMEYVCPNCSGELVSRPKRVEA
jgi:uncharacterized protein